MYICHLLMLSMKKQSHTHIQFLFLSRSLTHTYTGSEWSLWTHLSNHFRVNSFAAERPKRANHPPFYLTGKHVLPDVFCILLLYFVHNLHNFWLPFLLNWPSRFLLFLARYHSKSEFDLQYFINLILVRKPFSFSYFLKSPVQFVLG